MATAKIVQSFGDKLIKVNESVTVNLYDNGFMIAASGYNKEGDWTHAKIVCNTVEDVISLVREACEMDRDV